MSHIISVQLTDLSKEVLEAMKDQVLLGLNAIGQEAEGYAKDDCPVDTGRLRNSITYSTRNFGGVASYTDDSGNAYSDGAARGTPEEGSVYVGTNVEYAPYVEFRDYADHPVGKAHFLRDALATHTDHYKQILKAILKD